MLTRRWHADKSQLSMSAPTWSTVFLIQVQLEDLELTGAQPTCEDRRTGTRGEEKTIRLGTQGRGSRKK
jgi:hypothetical protein